MELQATSARRPLPLVATGAGLDLDRRVIDSVAAAQEVLDRGQRGERDDVGLTWLFLVTLAVRARDDSEGQERTRAFLRRRQA